MKKVRVETVNLGMNCTEKKVIIDNTPELCDKKGLGVLAGIEEAVGVCRSLLDEGYALVDYCVCRNREFKFTLKRFN